MPPANDNLADAVDLGNATSGSVTGSNVGATSQAFEPYQNGRSVWYFWQSAAMTTPPNGDYAIATATRMRFATRYNPGQASPTDFRTSLVVFKAKVWPITGAGDLQLVTAANRYAHWEDQTEVVFDTMPGDRFFILVDGAMKDAGGTLVPDEGNFTLWWEQWAENKILGCGTCAPSDADGECLGTLNADPYATRELTYPASGNAAAGTYVLRYCGGAWNYRSGWSVGRIPPTGDQNWTQGTGGAPPLEAGYFFSWRYRSSGANAFGHFTENNIPNSGSNTYGTPDGYFSAALAESALGCQRVTFKHDGTGPILLRWTDNQLDDNSIGPNGPPVFSLFRPVLRITPLYACSTKVSAGVYDVSFTVRNQSDVAFTGVSATCLLAGGVTASTTATFDVLATQITFTLRLAISGPVGGVTVRLSDFSGALKDLGFDLAPYVSIESSIANAPTCAGFSKGCYFTFKLYGLAADNLIGTVQTGPGFDLASVAEYGTCTPGGVFSFGPANCTVIGKSFSFNLSAPKAEADIVIHWADGALAMPPTSFRIAL
jgi:hypothetical protein